MYADPQTEHTNTHGTDVYALLDSHTSAHTNETNQKTQPASQTRYIQEAHVQPLTGVHTGSGAYIQHTLPPQQQQQQLPTHITRHTHTHADDGPTDTAQLLASLSSQPSINSEEEADSYASQRETLYGSEHARANANAGGQYNV